VKVFVKGKGEVNLGQANFVAQGGQASVYQKNGTAYKIYSDPKDTIPEAKFLELSRISDDHVVKPRDLLIAAGGPTPIGYTMDYLPESYALCQLFTRAFRDRNNVDHEAVRRLVSELQSHVISVHSAGALIVDLNELNILVSKDFGALHLIDVDSYQTASFKAEVIMPSVRDWSVKPEQFSQLSDWFSFAVLACQMYVGLHPYRGKHEPSNGVPADQRLEHRMRNHVSIFDPSVSVPKACYPFDVIPPHQRAWLTAVLQQGKRVPPPPANGGAPVVISAAHSQQAFTSGTLLVTRVCVCDGDVLAYHESGDSTLIHTTDGVFLNARQVHLGRLPGTTLLGFTTKFNRPIALNLHAGTLTLHEFLERRVTRLTINASELAGTGSRFYIRNGTQILEVDLTELPSSVLVTASHPVANVLESASRLFDGCAIQNMLGSAFVSLFPSTRAGYQVRMPELDAYRIVEAKFEGRVLMVLGSKVGQYDRLIFRFDATFSSYDMRTVSNISPSGLNFLVTTRTGICVSITEDEHVEAFAAAKDAVGIKLAKDPAVGVDMRLTHVAGRVGFARGSSVSTLSMR
jgi:serine/threonine protein kinase